MIDSRRRLLRTVGAVGSSLLLAGCLRDIQADSSTPTTAAETPTGQSNPSTVAESTPTTTAAPDYPVSLAPQWQLEHWVSDGEIRIHGDLLYLLSRDRGVHTYRLADGSQVWRRGIESPAYPVEFEAIGPDVLVRLINSEQGNVRGLASFAPDGSTEHWRRWFEDWDFIDVQGVDDSSVLVKVWRAPGSDSFVVLNRDDGSQRWKLDDRDDLALGVVGGGKAYVADDENDVTLVLDLETGEQVDSLSEISLFHMYQDGYLLSSFSKYDLDTGREYDLLDGTSVDRPVVYDSVLYVATGDGIAAVDLESNQLKWERSLDVPLAYVPRPQPDVVWAVSERGSLLGFSHDDGEVIYRRTLIDAGPNQARPAVVTRGDLLIASEPSEDSPIVRAFTVRYDP